MDLVVLLIVMFKNIYRIINEKADEHFGRLRAWGLTFIRLLITWEAVEHKGPGQYDEDYVNYLGE
jgi:hypothetical protein